MKKIQTFFLTLMVLAFSNATLFAQPDNFDIAIKRNSVVGNLVYCTIYLNGQEIGSAFENNDLKIPTGSYKGLMRYNSGKDFVQSPMGKLSTKGDFLLEASGVDGGKRTDILLHQGNAPKHSLGCILLGPAKRGPDGGLTIGTDSPLRKLRLAFYGTDEPISCPNKNITITVSDDYIVSGSYVANETIENIAVTTELTILKNGTNYSGAYKMTGGGQTSTANIPIITITNNRYLSFSFMQDGVSYTFSGEFSSNLKEIQHFKEAKDSESTILKKK